MGCPNKDDLKAPSFAVKLQWHFTLLLSACALRQSLFLLPVIHPRRVGSLSGPLLLMLQHNNEHSTL